MTKNSINTVNALAYVFVYKSKKKKKEKTNVKQSDVDNLCMQFTHGSRNFYGALNFFILNMKYEKRNNKLFTVHLHVCLHWIYN